MPLNKFNSIQWKIDPIRIDSLGVFIHMMFKKNKLSYINDGFYYENRYYVANVFAFTQFIVIFILRIYVTTIAYRIFSTQKQNCLLT